MESKKPSQEFGRRKPSVPVVARPVRPGPPAKRSGHVALLLMGTFAVGSAGYALLPGDHCERPPNVASPLQSNAECPPRESSSSGGGSSSRSGFYSGDSSSSHSASGTSSPSSSGVTRGGFGSFAHAFGFSGG